MSDIPKRHFFPKVREAREALAAYALELAEMKKKAIQKALDLDQLDVAIKAIQWMEEHMPAIDGVTMIDASIDKPKPVERGPAGPVIQIGFALGGIPESQRALPPSIEIIEIKPDDTDQ